MTKYIVSSGVNSGTTLSSGDIMSVFNSGTALDTIVNSGGQEVVYGGGISSASNDSGIELISAGGSSVETLIENHGIEKIFASGIAISTTVQRGSLYVFSGGTSEFLRSLDSGRIYISSGGLAVGDLLSGGGFEVVYAGGTASGTQTFRNNRLSGEQIINGGRAVNTIVADGDQLVASNGVASGAYIEAYQQIMGAKAYGTTLSGVSAVQGDYAVQTVYSGGMAHGTLIDDFSQEFVSSGGVAIGSKIHSGGIEIVSSGGTTRKTTINGGTLEIASGGSAEKGIKFSGAGGTLAIDGAVMPDTTISGFKAGDSIVLSAVPYSAGDLVSVNETGIVTVSSGGATYNLNIAGAVVGETDFAFGSGSVLTKGTRPKMMFERPPAEPSAAVSLWVSKAFVPASGGTEHPLVYSVTSASHAPGLWPTQDHESAASRQATVPLLSHGV